MEIARREYDLNEVLVYANIFNLCVYMIYTISRNSSRPNANLIYVPTIKLPRLSCPELNVQVLFSEILRAEC
jgi:hypothetical protein